MENFAWFVRQWLIRNFGSSTFDRKERALRLFEEATELAQAEGVPIEKLRAQLVRTFDRPIGDPYAEAGGVAVCLLGWCSAARVTVDAVARREVERISAIPESVFRERHAKKVHDGVAVGEVAMCPLHDLPVNAPLDASEPGRCEVCESGARAHFVIAGINPGTIRANAEMHPIPADCFIPSNEPIDWSTARIDHRVTSICSDCGGEVIDSHTCPSHA